MVNILELQEGDYVKILNTGIDLDLYSEVEDMLTADRLKVKAPVQEYKFEKGKEYIPVWDSYESDFQYFSADELELVETLEGENKRLLEERMLRRDNNRGLDEGTTAKERKKYLADKASKDASETSKQSKGIIENIEDGIESGEIKTYNQTEINEIVNPTLPVGIDAFRVSITPNEAPLGMEDLDKDEWIINTRIEAVDIFEAVQNLSKVYNFDYNDILDEIESPSFATFTVDTQDGQCLIELERV